MYNMEEFLTNNTSLQFDTPHSGKKHNKIKITVVVCIALAALVFNVWYYFGSTLHISKEDTQEIVVPPTEQEKVAISADLQNRSSKISINERADMVQNLVRREGTNIGLEDREEAVKAFEN